MFEELKARVRGALTQAAGVESRDAVVHGLPVRVENSRPDIDTDHVIARLDAALALIKRLQPWHFRRFRRDIALVLVQRYACRGAYLPSHGIVLVELTFTVNPAFTEAEVAATVLHEAMHARLDRAGVQDGSLDRAKHERFCRRAELEFGAAVTAAGLPGGDRVLDRALGTLAAADDEVAPAIDWALAERRVAQADLDALKAPGWLKQAIGRRQGPDRGEG